MEYSSIIFERKCNVLFVNDIFVFACIDKSPNCQESYHILLKNGRPIAANVYFVYIYKWIIILFAWPPLRLCDIGVFICCLLLTMSEV